MAGLVVLGAGGLIGRATVIEARRLGIEPVRGVGRARRTPADLGPALTGWDSVDLVTTEPHVLGGLLRSYMPQAIINCVGRTEGGPARLTRANVVATAVIVEAVARMRTSTRLVQIGSAAEYGKPVKATSAISELDAARPVTTYGVTKLAAAQIVLVAARKEGIDAVVARVFNPIGAGMPVASLPGHALHRIREAVEGGTDRVEFGPLSAVRDYIDLRDVASALLTIGFADALADDVLNVGSGAGTVVRTIPSFIADRLGFSGNIVETGDGSPRSSDVTYQRADISRLTGLGWHPRYDLGASVDALVAGLTGRP